MEKTNEFAERMEALSKQEQEYVKLIMEEWLDNLQEALDIIESGDYIVWYDCNSMADVAYSYMEESGMLHNVPSSIANYFDYEALGRDMDIEGTYLEGDGYYLEILN